MRTPSTSPRRFAHRLAAVGLTLLTATAAGLGSAGAAAAAEDAASPLAVLAPVTNAFSDTEETPLDQVLNGLVPEEAADVIATALNAADPVLADGEASSDDSSSASTGDYAGGPRELNLECDPETGSCHEVSGDDAAAIAPAPAPYEAPAAKAKTHHGKNHHPRPRH